MKAFIGAKIPFINISEYPKLRNLSNITKFRIRPIFKPTIPKTIIIYIR